MNRAAVTMDRDEVTLRAGGVQLITAHQYVLFKTQGEKHDCP